jgi:acetyltransferase-like isoleucine patch superfamily enzyme
VLGNVDFSYEFLSENPDVAVFVPIGNNEVRLRLLSEYEKRNVETPSFVHEKTIIHHTVTFGKGVYVLPGTNIMPFTNIGDFVMISMGVNIAHHVDIERGCFFSQGANIGASIKISESCYFGIASTVMTGVTHIGKNCLIGASALINKNVGENLVMAGIPAKILRENYPVLLSERK